MTLNPRRGRFQKSPSFQSAVTHPLARTPLSTTSRASASAPSAAAGVEPRRAFPERLPSARVAAPARPAPLPPRSPARPRSQARRGLRALLGLARGAPGMAPRGSPRTGALQTPKRKAGRWRRAGRSRVSGEPGVGVQPATARRRGSSSASSPLWRCRSPEGGGATSRALFPSHRCF